MSSSRGFGCVPSRRQPTKYCILEGVGACADYVSHLICNKHALIFKLTYKSASYQNGDNDTWSRINTYAATNTTFNLPLFLDRTNKVLMSEIRSFAISVANEFRGYNVDELQDRIACLMGVNGFNNKMCIRGWLDEPTSQVIVRSNTGIGFYSDVPLLHKCLFYYMHASNLRNTGNVASQIYLIPSISLTYNEVNNSYAFVMPNKKLVLKYTDRNDCVATSLVLDAVREVTESQNDITIRPVRNIEDSNCI